MSINENFVKNILEALDTLQYFQPTVNIRDLEYIGFNINHQRFIVHAEYIQDSGLVNSASYEHPMGLVRHMDEDHTWNVLSLRLSNEGRSFLTTKRISTEQKLSPTQIQETQQELNHLCKTIYDLPDLGFQDALRKWLYLITTDPVLSLILWQLRNNYEYLSLHEDFNKGLREGYLPYGNNRKESLLMAYFLTKHVLSGDEGQQKLGAIKLLHVRLSFTRVTAYLNALETLVSDFKEKYVKPLTEFLFEELKNRENQIKTLIPQTKPKHEMVPRFGTEEKRNFVEKLKGVSERLQQINNDFSGEDGDEKDQARRELLLETRTLKAILKHANYDFQNELNEIEDILSAREDLMEIAEYPDKFAGSVKTILDIAPIVESLIRTFDDGLGPNIKMEKKKMKDTEKKVFIVHGQNHDVRNNIDRYLLKLGLKTTIMDEEANEGDTLPEKFERIAKECSYAIFLMTMDDKLIDAKKLEQVETLEEAKQILPMYRARQNVLIEIGYFWGVLGRKRVAVVVEEHNHKDWPSDLQGIARIPITPDLEGTKNALLKELKAAGIYSEAI